MCNGAFYLLHILLKIGLTTLEKGKLFDIFIIIYLFVYLFILFFRPQIREESMLFVTNCATGWRDHLILQTKILDAKCGTFFLLQLCLHLSPLAKEKTSFFQWLFKWILLLVCMSLFSIDKNLHRKKLNPFTSNSSCIRLTASGFSESRAWSETKRQINGKRGGQIRAERGDRHLFFVRRDIYLRSSNRFSTRRLRPKFLFQPPVLVGKYPFRISSIEKWYPSTSPVQNFTSLSTFCKYAPLKI